MMNNKNHMIEVLQELGTFYYLPNAGNLGDQTIACATREFFRKNDLSFLPYSAETAERGEELPLVYGGGGPFVPYYGMVPSLLRMFQNPRLKKIVILPSSFFQCDELAAFFDERFTVFCREERSFHYLSGLNKRARFLMADDMAFTLDARKFIEDQAEELLTYSVFQHKIQALQECLHVLEDGRKVLLFLRGDVESLQDVEAISRRYKTFDLSGLAHGSAEDVEFNRLMTCLFLYGLDQADVVLTDRLHGGICSHLLGKETYLLDNSYGKLSGVYEFSLKGCERVTMLESLKEFPYQELLAPSPEKEGALEREEEKSARKKASILVGICSGHGYYERRKAVRDTWLTHPQEGITCLFFLGGEVPERELSDTVGLDAPDDYLSLPAKVLAFFRYALENYDFDWLFKCDDDTYLDLSRLPELADARYGLVGDVLLGRRGSPSGGAGYLLSRAIVEKIAARKDVPVLGAEDMIFGKLALEEGAVPHVTSRLYMSNAQYPAVHNDQVSAHWCNPELMRVLELLRYGSPDAVYHGKHRHWKDDLLFYKEGIFRRRSTSCYGWWSVAPDHILTLRWKAWGEEQFIRDGAKYCGSLLELTPKGHEQGTKTSLPLLSFTGRSPERKTADVTEFGHDRMELLHLGCGGRLLPGWLNLDLPRYDLTRPLPWKDASVRAYFLEHVVEYISPAALSRFLREAWRTLKPDGVLRLAVTDRVIHAAGVRMNYAPFRQEQTGVVPGPGWELEALIGHDEVRSFWTEASLSVFLKLAGYEVRVHEPGQSDDALLQGLERKNAPEEDPFCLLGRICVEARKPMRSPLLPCPPLNEAQGKEEGVRCSEDAKRFSVAEPVCVAPYFCSGSRTGNRLFQIAAVYAHALRHGLECRVPWRSETQSRRLYELLGSDALVCPDGGYSDPVIYHEPHFSYAPIPATIRQGRLNGYFQSECYFADCAGEIRKLYARLTAPRQEGDAGVHVRMGDYLKRPDQFRSPDAAFLQEALSRLSESIRVLHVFSDSPRLALELVRSVPASRRFELVLNEEDTLDALRSMSGMQELVMSCSSYSWWAAYLGEPDQVIVQQDWFTGKISDYQDVYRESWIKL